MVEGGKKRMEDKPTEAETDKEEGKEKIDQTEPSRQKEKETEETEDKAAQTKPLREEVNEE